MHIKTLILSTVLLLNPLLASEKVFSVKGLFAPLKIIADALFFDIKKFNLSRN